MGLLDKLKNVFFEEEYVEVEEPEVKEKPKKVEKAKRSVAKEEKIAKKIEVPKREEKKEMKREENKATRREDKELEDALFGEETSSRVESFSDRDLLQPEPAFRLFDDDDFMQEEKKPVSTPTPTPSPLQKVESRPAYGGDYSFDASSLYKEKEKERTFKPTPIISPIYGILDQNYSKDDIVDKNNRSVGGNSSKKVDLDSVREKAYGTLSSDLGLMDDDIPPVDLEHHSEIEDNLLYDMSDSGAPAVEKVTIADAEEYFEDLGLEYNIDYKDKSQEKANGRDVQHIPDDEMDVTEAKPKHSKKEEDDVPPTITTTDDDTLEDNLFDLIDSMYEEKE